MCSVTDTQRYFDGQLDKWWPLHRQLRQWRCKFTTSKRSMGFKPLNFSQPSNLCEGVKQYIHDAFVSEYDEFWGLAGGRFCLDRSDPWGWAEPADKRTWLCRSSSCVHWSQDGRVAQSSDSFHFILVCWSHFSMIT